MDIRLIDQLQKLDENKPLINLELLRVFQRRMPFVTNVIITPQGYLMVTANVPSPTWVSPVGFKGLEYVLEQGSIGSAVKYFKKPHNGPIGDID